MAEFRAQGYLFAEDLLLTGVTYRQIDYWCSQGRLPLRRIGAGGQIVEERGPGRFRLFTAAERDQVAVVLRLLGAGVGLDLAWNLARRGPGTHEVAPGLSITIAPSASPLYPPSP